MIFHTVTIKPYSKAGSFYSYSGYIIEVERNAEEITSYYKASDIKRDYERAHDIARSTAKALQREKPALKFLDELTEAYTVTA